MNSEPTNLFRTDIVYYCVHCYQLMVLVLKLILVAIAQQKNNCKLCKEYLAHCKKFIQVQVLCKVCLALARNMHRFRKMCGANLAIARKWQDLVHNARLLNELASLF